MTFTESSTLTGRLLRLPLRLLPGTAVVRVCSGALRGARWIVGSSTHGCWLGTYEADKQRAFAAHLHPGLTVYDVGANVGFYSLIASRVGGAVVAFEPVPRNLNFLRRHLELNGAANARVVAAAVGAANGTVHFDFGAHPSCGRVACSGNLEVAMVSLDQLLAEGSVPEPDLIKIDVEGAEADVLAGAERLLRRRHPTIFLATHGQAVHDRCVAILTDHGYELRPLDRLPLERSDELLAVYTGQ